MHKYLPCLVLAAVVVSTTQTAIFADAVSQNGKTIVYCRQTYDLEAEPVTRVYLRPVEGSGERQICELPGHLSDIFWLAPDKIALSSPYETRNYLVIRPDGRRLQDITLPQGCHVLYKTLSPDASKIAFVGGYQASEKAENQPFGLFVCDLRTDRVVRLIAKAVKTNPAWSPDSRRLAIGVGEDYTRDYPLWIIDAETGKIDDTKWLGVGTVWSPDGRYIACTTEVARGGSWSRGIPGAGKLGIYDVTARTMKVLAGTEGAMMPAWSRNGKQIAYMAQESLNVIGSDGSRPRRLQNHIDIFGGVSWLGDQAIFLQESTRLSRVEISLVKVLTLAQWPAPKASEPSMSDFKIVQIPRVTVRYARFDRKYAQAFARILFEAMATYEQMGFKMPAKVTLEAYIDPAQTALWTDGASQMYLRLRSKELLGASTHTGVFNIYGMCHELGHIAMYPNLSSLMGLPAGVGEGWAHYIGSVVVSEVAKKMGASIWPEPYDISDVEGIGRLKRQADSEMAGGWDRMDPTIRVALVFYKLQSDLGRDKLTTAMVQALAQHPTGKDLMPLMVRQLKALTRDPGTADWAPESVLTPKVEWQVTDRHPGEAFFADQKAIKDTSGIDLCYDRGKMDTRQSMGGSGEAVLFRAPEGSWQLDGIQLFGARYGEEQPPKEDFSIYICDENFDLLHAIRLPYSTFVRGEEKWYHLAFNPVDVPRIFYVCVDFNATAQKGVYVGEDTHVARSHSRSAMPYSFVADMKSKADWMIRAHLRIKP